MRVLAVILVAALGAALPAAGADARRGKKKHRRHALVAKVHRGKAFAPPTWAVRPPAVAPAAEPLAEPPAPAAPPAPEPTAAPTPGSEVPGDNPHSVSVRSTEFRLSLSQPSVSAGEVRVQFDNSRAEDPHSLSYDGPTAAAFDPVAAGAVVRYTVTLEPGAYRLFCPLPEHEDLGMRATLTVR